MIFFILVQNVVLNVIPHFRDFCGNSAMWKILDFNVWFFFCHRQMSQSWMNRCVWENLHKWG